LPRFKTVNLRLPEGPMPRLSAPRTDVVAWLFMQIRAWFGMRL
jgi:hypothetical protein